MCFNKILKGNKMTKRMLNLALPLVVASLSQSVFARQICGEVMEYRGQRIIQPEERYWNYPTLIALNQDISKKLDGLVGKKLRIR